MKAWKLQELRKGEIKRDKREGAATTVSLLSLIVDVSWRVQRW
jgi:hypothetical protein